jgi:outer membrane protein assembly factor BamD
MPNLLLRRIRVPVLGLVLAISSLFLPARLAADLMWNAQTGWRLEGGAVSGLVGTDGRNAIDLMNKARTAEESGSTGSAISSYEKVAKRYPNSVYAPEALFRAAKLQLTRKQYVKAFESYQTVTLRYPNTKRFNEIVGEQYRIAGALLDGARNRTWGWLPGFRNREKAIEFFEIVLLTAPYSDYAPLALMNIARGHARLHDIPEAIDALDRMINNYPQSLLAPDAYLKLAQAHASLVEGPYYDQASTKEAVTYFEDFMILFPSDANIAAAAKGLDNMKIVLAESKFKIGDFYFYRRDNFKAAKVFYNEAITAYPDSDVAKRARLRLNDVEAKAAGKKVAPEDRKKILGLF